MNPAPDLPSVVRFACTQCGACCNHPPEVALSEAAALAGDFVFRLAFRLYELPRTWADHAKLGQRPEGGPVAFHQRKRLLAAFSANTTRTRLRTAGGAVESIRYLTISALPVNTAPGTCGALQSGRCTIYDRRPLACRTVPFHYSRVEGGAELDLRAFVERPGYRCDTSDSAPVILREGTIVDDVIRRGRVEAVSLAKGDGSWSKAIVRQMKARDLFGKSLPSFRDIEANASVGMLTTSMRIAWLIAVKSGLMDAAECRRLVDDQAGVISRELAADHCPSKVRQTLAEMHAEYRLWLSHPSPEA